MVMLMLLISHSYLNVCTDIHVYCLVPRITTAIFLSLSLLHATNIIDEGMEDGASGTD